MERVLQLRSAAWRRRRRHPLRSSRAAHAGVCPPCLFPKVTTRNFYSSRRGYMSCTQGGAARFEYTLSTVPNLGTLRNLLILASIMQMACFKLQLGACRLYSWQRCSGLWAALRFPCFFLEWTAVAAEGCRTLIEFLSNVPTFGTPW